MAKCQECRGSGNTQRVIGYSRTSTGFSPTEYRDDPIYDAIPCDKCNGYGVVQPYSDGDLKKVKKIEARRIKKS